MADQLQQSVSTIVNNFERKQSQNRTDGVKPYPVAKPKINEQAVAPVVINNSNTTEAEALPAPEAESPDPPQAMANPEPPESNVDLEETFAYLDSVFKCCPFCDEPASVDEGRRRRVLVNCSTCNRDWCYSCEVPWHEGLSCMDYKDQVTAEVEVRDNGNKGKKKQPFHLKRGECSACFEMKAVWQSPCCQEEFCLTCLDTYLSDKVDQGVIDIRCPGHACESLLDPSIIRKVVVSDKSKRLSFLRVKLDRYENRKACPLCDVVLSLEDCVARFCERQKQIVCPECLAEFCFTCRVPWHKKLTCGEYKAMNVVTGIDTWARKTSQLNQRNAQKCPSCKTWIQRIDGCYMMICKACQTRFCYDCGAATPHPPSSTCKNFRY